MDKEFLVVPRARALVAAVRNGAPVVLTLHDHEGFPRHTQSLDVPLQGQGMRLQWLARIALDAPLTVAAIDVAFPTFGERVTWTLDRPIPLGPDDSLELAPTITVREARS